MIDTLSLIYESMQFDPKELEMGMEVEKEHSDDIDVRRKIATDHLSEDPKYYSKLKQSGIKGEN